MLDDKRVENRGIRGKIRNRVENLRYGKGCHAESVITRFLLPPFHRVNPRSQPGIFFHCPSRLARFAAAKRRFRGATLMTVADRSPPVERLRSSSASKAEKQAPPRNTRSSALLQLALIVLSPFALIGIIFINCPFLSFYK